MRYYLSYTYRDLASGDIITGSSRLTRRIGIRDMDDVADITSTLSESLENDGHHNQDLIVLGWSLFEDA